MLLYVFLFGSVVNFKIILTGSTAYICEISKGPNT